MKLQQNAGDLVLICAEGLGTLVGEIRYNRQTETPAFALEKAAYFDLHFPCAVIYDPERGPVVHPHLLAALATSSIRVQRTRVTCFVLGDEINPAVAEQYRALRAAILSKGPPPSEGPEPPDDGPGGKGPGPRIVDIHHLRGRPGKK
ncbi:hypothetical protein G3N55_04955 [Dissulfurirhabdus thermomarina]|uniref:Uncharacterized protein n=1 Tax=Dissulfurirhabdus thermomarina TaxID=1765737 RepID=A0A6N9TLT6_DISTH|nr:hypothetical protein [Dissulfurirhabdus thermomarina]NDY42195.1 hypothetical protein [Dissulfurirhabdus thermomarina]NMX22677.1 hypothetical protein [Dissulfurirhabdus thermomarina]